MTQTTFHWQLSDMTPELLAAVGAVTIWWAMIDDQITRALEPLWFDQQPQERMPRSFDRRINHLVDIMRPLYANEPDEYRIFMWFIQRIKDANGRRDAVAHGIPGTISKRGRALIGLMVPFPSRKTRYMPMANHKINELVGTLTQLHRETGDVTSALWAVRNAASGNARIWRDPDGWSLVTMDNRSPKLPREIPPPPTFQV